MTITVRMAGLQPYQKQRRAAYLVVPTRRKRMDAVAEELHADLRNDGDFDIVWELCFPETYKKP